MSVAAQPGAFKRGGELRRLPLVTLYLTDRCNSRCITCDYWRHGRTNLTYDKLTAMLPSLAALRTEVAVLSGGEPLLNPEWARIAEALRTSGLKAWLLTSGLSLAKHAVKVASLFDAVTVSLDGTTPATYAAIRGLDAFDKVCAGIRAAVAAGANVNLRVTLQRANYRELQEFVTLAQELRVRQISFLAVDVSNAHAFAREAGAGGGLTLAADDVSRLRDLLAALRRDHPQEFKSRFIAESPEKLERIVQYFSALGGAGDFPRVVCNAPEFSAVITADRRLQPCFFIPGPESVPGGPDLEASLNDTLMQDLRGAIGAGKRPECQRCVCSMWREPDLGDSHSLSESRASH